MSSQTQTINRHRYKLLDYFCKYDLGKINQNELESAMKEMKIFPTQAYKSYMRKKCGDLKFTEFLSALSLSDDKLVNDMMNIPNHAIPVELKNTNKQETLLESPHRSRAVGQYNNDIYRYNQGKDFLKWKSPKQIHQNDHHIYSDTLSSLSSLPSQSKIETATQSTQFELNQQRAKTSDDVQQVLSPKTNKNAKLKIYTDKLNDDNQENENHVEFTETNEFPSVKELCKMYCQGSISINEFEKRIKGQIIKLNAQQQRIINLCKIHPNVSLSELLLSFPEPKYQSIGNFDVEEAINAQREPLIFVDHPSDIITWKNDNHNTTFNRMTRRRTFKKPQRSDILTWQQISNQEFNEKVIRKKPPARGSDSFHSHIAFDQDLVPNESNMENTLPCVKKVKTELDHFKSTADLLKWKSNKKQNETISNYKLSHIKYRRDDRVPYQQN